MIFEELDRVIDDIQKLHRAEEIQKNRKDQQNNDVSYKNYVARNHKIISNIHYLSKQVNFQISNELIDNEEQFLDMLNISVQSHAVKKEDLDICKDKLDEIEKAVNDEWSKFYENTSNATLTTLEIIKNLEPEACIQCINSIKKGKKWGSDQKDYLQMKIGLDRAKTIIDGIGLDPEITSFLQKMNEKKATVNELTDNILSWIHHNNLGSKIKLSFV